jgi:hypothetical protein
MKVSCREVLVGELVKEADASMGLILQKDRPCAGRSCE